MRVVDGGAGKRAPNPDEPRPAAVRPCDVDPPAHLSDKQKELFRASLESVPPGMLTRLDFSVFTSWVVACDIYADALRKLNDFGLLVKMGEQSGPSPYLSMVNKQAQLISKFASELGFSPTSRTRVKLDRGAKKQSPFGELKELD